MDPNEENRITFYISDAWGYRPVKQEEATEIFYPAENPEGTTDMKGTLTQWTDLVFPEKCSYFAQQIAAAAPPKPRLPAVTAGSRIPPFTPGPIGGGGIPSIIAGTNKRPSGAQPLGNTFASNLQQQPGLTASKVPIGSGNNNNKVGIVSSNSPGAPGGPPGLVLNTNSPIASASQALVSNSGRLPGPNFPASG